MKKSLLMLLVLTLIFSTFCSVTVSADATVTRVSLAGNTSFYSSAVPASAKLDVKAYGADGSEISLEGKSVTYKSSRPWVFDIEADGTITDYGYDGTTIVTATVDGVEGSIVMIKSTSDTAATKGFETNLTAGSKKIADGKAYYGYDDGNGTIEADENSRIAGEKYFDGTWRGLYYKGAWDSKETDGGADIHVAQGWFYDNLESTGTVLYITFANKYIEKVEDSYLIGGAATTVTDGTNGYIPAWSNVGNSSIMNAVKGSTGSGYYFHGQISTKAGSGYYCYTDAAVASSIKRSKGWHQVTLVINDDATIEQYIDGIKLNTNTEKYSGKPISNGTLESNITSSPNFYFDDFVYSQNLNTEKPEGFKKAAEKIVLSRNKTFITNVTENPKLIVTPLDANGEEGALPAGATLTYESSRPWVLDIDANGNLVDGGYDGTTKVTVTASNGMKASTIFIKNADNVYADKSYQTADSDINAGAFANIGAGLRLRGTWINPISSLAIVKVNAESTSAEDKAVAKIPGKNYYKLPTGNTYSPVPDYGITAGCDALNETAQNNKTSWYKEGLRVMQGWFYDDGTSAVQVRSFMSEPSDYLGGSYGGGVSHLYWQSDVVAAEGSNAYSIDYKTTVTANTQKEINRSKGWHQVTTIFNDDKTIDVFVDGELLSTSKAHENVYTECKFYIAGGTAGNYDEFVVAANPNTERPVEITVAAGENGTVTYNGEAVSKVATTDGKTVEFEIAPAEGYVIDKITYNGQELTATDGKVSVKAANAILSVIFKAEVKIPAIKTTEVKTEGVTHGDSNIPAAITYVDIIPGNGGAVSEAGILLGFNGVQMALKAYASYTDKDNNTPLTSGSFAIKVYGDVVTGVECTSKPYVKYNNAGAETTAYGEEASFTISK